MNWKSRFGAVAGNTFEFFDIAVFTAISGYIAAAMTQQGIEHATHIVWGIFALRFIIRPLGGYCIGRYADHYGRKSALILTSTLTGFATLCMAALPVNTLGSALPLTLLILQMIQAFSFGGEYPALINYLFSTADRKEFSKISCLIVGSSIAGVLISLLLVMLLEHTLDREAMQQFGWRIPLLAGLVNVALGFWFRYRLPDQPVKQAARTPVNTVKTVRIFLITVPGAVVFYVHNMAGVLLRDLLHLEEFKNIYPVFSSASLLLILFLCGWITDRFFEAYQVFRKGIAAMVVLAIPLYFLLGSKDTGSVLCAHLVLTAIAACILGNLAAVLAQEARDSTASLGTGYNVALSIFGGLSPLAVSTLLSLGHVFPGIYIAASGLAFFATALLPSEKTAPVLSEPPHVPNALKKHQAASVHSPD